MSIRTCRLCLNEDSFSLNLFGDESRCRDVLHKIKFCIPVVKISKNDSNPRHICFKCLSTLETMSEFMKKCVASESILTRSSQVTNDEIMNLSVCSAHSQSGKYRQSQVGRSASITSSRDSTPDRAMWDRGTNAESSCYQKQSDRAPMQDSAPKKRKADTFSSTGSYLHPPTFGGAAQVGRKPEANQQRHNFDTESAKDIFSRFSKGSDEEEPCDKFLTDFWKEKSPPVKRANSSTQPDKDRSFQIPRSSAADSLTAEKDAPAPRRATDILGHVIDNWKPIGDKLSRGLDRSQILDCVNN